MSKPSMTDLLLEQLRHRGLDVKYQNGDTLLLIGPAAERTEDVMRAVKAFKPQLLELLRPRDVSQYHEVHHQAESPHPT